MSDTNETDDMPDALKGWFWSGFIKWAWSEKQIRERFMSETGIKLIPAAKSAVDALVDQATGAQDQQLHAFVKWATVELYGIEGAPKSYRDFLTSGGEP